jgi:TPR repeat protein
MKRKELVVAYAAASAAWFLFCIMNWNVVVRYSLLRFIPSVSQDESETVRLYRKAAEQGDPDAQNNLGVMYQNGRGVRQDDAQAVTWYLKAAEQGHALAQNNLGFMYQNGRSVRQDDSQAVRWYRKAAEQGYALGQYNLGGHV